MAAPFASLAAHSSRQLEPFAGLMRLIIERLRLRGAVARRPQCPKEEQDLQARAFDELAAEYDVPFTESANGRTTRALGARSGRGSERRWRWGLEQTLSFCRPA
jgi:hypothetical protein